ncbi:grainyhead-like protein 1 homolog isoform X1 [Hydra vulgaris]|nr:grainyhead-like protein 1 homolog isoform X1 [Hydra vulgaris]
MTSMFKKINELPSESESSPEESFVYLTPAFVRETEDKIWKSSFSMPDLLSPSPLLANPSEENMNNQVSFLYDYYGMTDESRQDPPSPGHSSVTSVDDNPDGINILEKQQNGSPNLSIKQSFHESGKSCAPFSTQINAVSSSSKFHSVIGNRRTQSTPCFKSENVSECSSSSISNSTEKLMSRNTFPYVRRINYDTNQKYIFILEAQTSVVQKREDETLTYLNKGQFYYITFESGPENKCSRAKSIIHLVFRDEKDEMTELTNWKYWYNQQPNFNQRAFDIERKACQNVIIDNEEYGYNALAFLWSPYLKAKVSFRINCLSTDFTPQKGVKGLPLYIQIDTYEDMSENAQPVHQAFCKIKIFRDKGAERKNKEESKTVGKRMVKYLKQGPDFSTIEVSPFQIANKVTVLKDSPFPITKSFVFIPIKDKIASPLETSSSLCSPPGAFITKIKERDTKRGFNNALSNTSDYLENLDVYPKLKTQRVYQKDTVTIYVRKEEEKAYNALLLTSPTLNVLKEAISKKYNIPSEMIRNVYKKTKKGFLVNIDDQLVERFAEEDDFVIDIRFDNHLGQFEVVFDS